MHRAFRKITSTINQQMHLYNFHLKHLNYSDMFRSFQIIVREFRRSLLKLLHIHDLVRFCKQAFVAAYRTQHDMLPQHLVYKNELNRE